MVGVKRLVWSGWCGAGSHLLQHHTFNHMEVQVQSSTV